MIPEGHRITVFTPTFNRAYRLKNLYESLRLQTYKDFEWLVIDDGSIDATRNLVEDWIQKKELNIRYFFQDNSGKHVAINNGIQRAKGEYFFIVDSDDKLPEDSLETIDNIIHQNKELVLGGVVGRKAYFNGEIVGSSDTFEYLLSNTIEIRYKHFVQGDLAEVFRTNVLKKFPFPVFENEKFCPEALVWNRISRQYDFVYFNKPIYYCEYLDDGLTKKNVEIRIKSPLTAMLHYSELEKYDIPLKEKLKSNINFWRFSFYSKESIFNKIRKVNMALCIIGFPLGLMLYVYDKVK